MLCFGCSSIISFVAKRYTFPSVTLRIFLRRYISWLYAPRSAASIFISSRNDMPPSTRNTPLVIIMQRKHSIGSFYLFILLEFTTILHQIWWNIKFKGTQINIYIFKTKRLSIFIFFIFLRLLEQCPAWVRFSPQKMAYFILKILIGNFELICPCGSSCCTFSGGDWSLLSQMTFSLVHCASSDSFLDSTGRIIQSPSLSNEGCCALTDWFSASSDRFSQSPSMYGSGMNDCVNTASELVLLLFLID